MTPIILLHGLGAHTATLLPLEWYLNFNGYKNTYKLSYPVDDLDFEETLEYVDSELQKLFNKEESIIIIGQSMGGVVANNIHKKGWDIKLAIYIGSPLHGANFINQIEKFAPKWFVDMIYKKPYDFLKLKENEPEPPHPYKTISCGCRIISNKSYLNT